MVGPYLEAPYRFWRRNRKNLNAVTNNFLKRTNFNYLCCTFVILEAKDVIPITNYCKVIKIIKNIESNSVGVKFLSF
jgi:hypothetical protein